MISTKWFDVSVGSKPSELLRLLRENFYDRSRSTGFDLSYARENAISGRFIEEVRSTSTYTSPLGEEITNHFVTHKIVPFALHYLYGSRWLLRVDGNPRSLKSFARCLSDLLNFGFSISQIITPALDVLSYLETSGLRIVRITNLYAANLAVGPGGLGKLEVRATANGDALASFFKAFPNVSHAIERISLQMEFGSQNTNVTLSKSGGVAFDDEFEDSVPQIYINYLTALLDPSRTT